MSSARVFGFVLLAACRPVVPPSDPGSEPADGEAKATPWTPSPDPTRTSAFEGETLAPEHAHHHHGHGAAKDGAAKDGDAKAGDQAKPPAQEPAP